MTVKDVKPVLSALRARSLPLLALLCPLLLVSPARGEEDDLRSLELYNGGKVDLVSADRSPRPASQTAENITVLTAKDIEALNAHTLADVLFTVAGVQLEMNRTPGTGINLDIQGSNFNHILVLIDNVPINTLAENFPDISSVSAQMIERVEVVKGAASSSWGSALGGVVNVITKSPQPDRPVDGVASITAGKKGTVDGRGELSGTLDRFGYYLTGGKLRSDGLVANNGVDQNSFYGKLRYDLPVHGSLNLTTWFTDSSSGQIEKAPRKVNQESRQLISAFSLQYPLSDHLAVEAMLRTVRNTTGVSFLSAADNSLQMQINDSEWAVGTSLSISWFDELQRVVGGVDYDHVKAHLSVPQIKSDMLNRGDDRVGVYLNDTFTLGDFALTPSARIDRSETGGNLFSPSFGLTYALTENSLLRGYTARGYSITSLNRSNSTEKVWTSQVGFESAEIPYLWLKGTFFRNDTWDVSVQDQTTGAFSKQRQLKQGYEVEARTLPCLATSFSLGYTFIDARNGDGGAVIKGIARRVINFAAKYEDSRYLRAQLTAHYIDWNLHKPSPGSKYDGVVWDLYLGKKISQTEYRSIELFLSVKNLFNADQYISYYKNPRRWGEVGVRCTF